MAGYADQEADFEWAFYLNRKFLEPVGLWPSDKKESRLKSAWLPLMLIIIVTGYCLPSAYAFVQVRHEVPLVVDNLHTHIASWIAACKVFILWYKRPVFRLLVKLARSDWLRRGAEDWERELMLKQARRGRLLTTVSYVAMFVHVNGFIFAPAFDLRIRIVNNITDPNLRHILPAQTYYPYEYHESPYYELTYLNFVISIVCAASAYTALDNFFSVLVFHASGQCEIIAEKMTRLFDGKRHRSLADRIQELVDSHNNLIRFVSAVEQSFSIIILIQILGSMVLICSVGYAVITAFDETPPAIQIVVLVVAVVNLNEHIFIYCVTAEILASNSSGIFDGVYSSSWYELPAREARCILLMMARAREPLQLSAGNFFYLSLNSYVQMVKSTAGYISMLLAVS